ncbi:MAG: hypothetical protein ACFBSE_22490 [Prochloraceae cyanobacterium]
MRIFQIVNPQQALVEGFLLAAIATTFASIFLIMQKQPKSVDPAITIRVNLITNTPNFHLPLDLASIAQSFCNYSTYYLIGKVIVNRHSYPALFLPFLPSEYDRDRQNFDCRIIFSVRHNSPALTDNQLAELSRLASQEILNLEQISR